MMMAIMVARIRKITAIAMLIRIIEGVSDR